ncbi:type IV pilin protein [Pseudomonas faucium]|uniref:type IV pilin protein n=1 Tax=Pseudomonas faucium TaxID=2740518 RepID=UPI001F1700C2|nr:type IV pilin protein [Pseudomonas faucium]
MQQGLSLIELLIVVAVIGILAAIAYPSYSEQLRRAGRNEAVGLLHDAALRLEQHRVRTGQYAEGDPALPVANRHYRLQAIRGSDTFTLLAQRLPNGLMADDRCGDYQLDQALVRSNPGGVEAAERCWGS